MPPRDERDEGTSAASPRRFEHLVLAHLDAAYNLARWMLRNDHDASDVVQEACLKAWRSFAGFRGGDPRVWLLAIVRTSALSRLRARRPVESGSGQEVPDPSPGLTAELLRSATSATVNRALLSLADPHREVLVLREVEGLSYAQIAAVLDVAEGTVMSRLARARDAFERALAGLIHEEERP
jgi:RNA polymerase sigma-70 factor (ECF subfamily)